MEDQQSTSTKPEPSTELSLSSSSTSSDETRNLAEQKLKEAELEIKLQEVKARIEVDKRNLWFSSPLIVAVSSAVFALLGTGIGAALQGYWNTQLERQKFESALIQKALDSSKKEDAANNLKFLVDAGLIQSLDRNKIAELAKRPADLPTGLEPRTSQIINNPVENGNRCRNPPLTATLNYWPVTYSDPAETCHDYPPVDVRHVGADRYSKSRDDWDDGVKAQTGDELYVLVWINNGAADNAERFLPGRSIARNVKLVTEVDQQLASSLHFVNVQFAGDNTNTVNSRFKIITAANERLEVIPSSGQILDYVGSEVLKTNLEVGNNTIVVGDIKPLFEDGRFIRFKLRVVS